MKIGCEGGGKGFYSKDFEKFMEEVRKYDNNRDY